jgi:glutaconyl-CoA/methylmalonyl-CoA decarboxylase subunit gamma
MKKFKFTISGNKYDVELLNIEDNVAEIEVNGTKYEVEIEKEIKTSKTPKLVRKESVPSTSSEKSTVKTSKPSEKKGAGTVKAPLPGVIVEIKARVGDNVKAGETLLIMEAMKMENNIKSDKEGKVISIAVNNGDSVLEGDILVEIGSN